MNPATASEWTGAAIVIAAALAILALLYFLYGDPDRSNRLSVRYGPYLYPAGASVIALGAIIDACRGKWVSALWSGGIAVLWLIVWRVARREATK